MPECFNSESLVDTVVLLAIYSLLFGACRPCLLGLNIGLLPPYASSIYTLTRKIAGLALENGLILLGWLP